MLPPGAASNSTTTHRISVDVAGGGEGVKEETDSSSECSKQQRRILVFFKAFRIIIAFSEEAQQLAINPAPVRKGVPGLPVAGLPFFPSCTMTKETPTPLAHCELRTAVPHTLNLICITLHAMMQPLSQVRCVLFTGLFNLGVPCINQVLYPILTRPGMRCCAVSVYQKRKPYQ